MQTENGDVGVGVGYCSEASCNLCVKRRKAQAPGHMGPGEPPCKGHHESTARGPVPPAPLLPDPAAPLATGRLARWGPLNPRSASHNIVYGAIKSTQCGDLVKWGRPLCGGAHAPCPYPSRYSLVLVHQYCRAQYRVCTADGTTLT